MQKYYRSIHLISTCYACKACVSPAFLTSKDARSFVEVAFVCGDATLLLLAMDPLLRALHPPIPISAFYLSLYLKTWSEFRSLDFAFEGKSRGQNDSLRRAPKVQKWCATTLWYGQWHHANVSVTSRTTKHYSTPNSFEITIHFPTCFWRPAMISVHTVTDACALLAAAQPLRPCSVTCTVAPFSKALFSAASREKSCSSAQRLFDSIVAIVLLVIGTTRLGSLLLKHRMLWPWHFLLWPYLKRIGGETPLPCHDFRPCLVPKNFTKQVL